MELFLGCIYAVCSVQVMLFTKFHLSHTCCVHVFLVDCLYNCSIFDTHTHSMKMSWKRFENFRLIKTNFIVHWFWNVFSASFFDSWALEQWFSDRFIQHFWNVSSFWDWNYFERWSRWEIYALAKNSNAKCWLL